MKNNKQPVLDEMQKEELEFQARKKRITEIANSDNYLEEMKKINAELNRKRTNKKVVNYSDLKKIFAGEEGEDGKR